MRFILLPCIEASVFIARLHTFIRGSLLFDICYCTTRQTPGGVVLERRNLGHDPIPAALGISDDSDKAT